jgi:hypothetical protein
MLCLTLNAVEAAGMLGNVHGMRPAGRAPISTPSGCKPPSASRTRHFGAPGRIMVAATGVPDSGMPRPTGTASDDLIDHPACATPRRAPPSENLQNFIMPRAIGEFRDGIIEPFTRYARRHRS